MKKLSKPIVFFGTEEFSSVSLRALLDAGFEIAVVVTKPDSAKGRSKKLTPSPVKVIAQNANIPVLQPEKAIEITDNLKKLQSPIGILVSYGNLIPDAMLDLFTPGIINIHPSLLPSYRGPSPIESAVLNGDSKTGVSIMKLTKEMDAGPVYSQIEIPLSNTEYADTLYRTLAQKGAEQLVTVLPSILDGSLQPSSQNEDNASYCQLIEKADGNIDWNDTASNIDREIRAYSAWPKSRTKLGDIEVIITKAHIAGGNNSSGKIELSDDKLLVYCGENSLEIEQIQPIGKKEMPIRAFLAGYKNRLIPE